MADEDLDIIELEESLADVERPPELPPGLYVGEVTDVQLQTSKAGNNYYAVRFNVPQEEIPADIQGGFEDGVILSWNRQIRSSSGKDRRALYNLRKFVEALGLDANSTSIDPSEWMGCRARLRVTQVTYLGEKRAQINSVEPVEREAAPRVAQEMEEEEVEEVEAPPPTTRGRRGRAM